MEARSYHNRRAHARRYRGPLATLRKRLRRGLIDARTALAWAVGAEHADAWISFVQRADVASVAAERYRDANGRVRGRRHTARARFRLSPQRDDTHELVRAYVLVLLAVLDGLGDGKKRVWHRRLWLGRDGVPAERAGGLASHVGRSVRTLERALAVWRGAGVLRAWQPKVDERTPAYARTATGRAYNCYELVPELPRRLRELQQEHFEGAARAARAAERATLTTASAPPPQPTVEDTRAAPFLALLAEAGVYEHHGPPPLHTGP